MATKSQLKKAYGDCTGPLGVPMKSSAAKALETLMKGLPQECREAGLKRADFIPKKLEFDADERIEVSVITADSIDRDNEVVLAKGLNWNQFKRAGMPVTFCHDYDALPVGRGKSIWTYSAEVKKDGQSEMIHGWKARTFYHTRPKGWEGQWVPDGIVHLIGEDGLKGKSIGFIPTEFSSPKPEDIKKRPELADVNFVIRKAIVLEYAVCTVQSNVDSLVQNAKCLKHFTDRALEHLGIILPSSEDYEDYDYSEKELDTESQVKYKVITQTSVSERLLRALKSK